MSAAALHADLLAHSQTRWGRRPLLRMKKSRKLMALARSLPLGEAACIRTLGRPYDWLPALIDRYSSTFPSRVRLREVVRFLESDEAWVQHGHKLRIAEWILPVAPMDPRWEVPRIDTAGDLAEWLWLEPSQLDWFADIKGLNDGALAHYHYRTFPKRSGGVRILEAPKPRLKKIQRQILDWILNPIPLHPAAHGFRKSRSIQTFVASHVAQHIVLRMDLKDFFPSITRARVEALFWTAGFSENVAQLLAALCTNAVEDGQDPLYRIRHLPQGAPTSPAIANLCAYRMDCRLSALAKAAGGEYTRYADDLAFSGDESFARSAARFSNHVAAIVLEEGFRVSFRKTRIMRKGVQQHLAGLVTNELANIPRESFDELKAILTNCVRQGPESQNRTQHPRFRDHLLGRIGFVESIHPARGAKLRAIFEKIAWT